MLRKAKPSGAFLLLMGKAVLRRPVEPQTTAAYRKADRKRLKKQTGRD